MSIREDRPLAFQHSPFPTMASQLCQGVTPNEHSSPLHAVFMVTLKGQMVGDQQACEPV